MMIALVMPLPALLLATASLLSPSSGSLYPASLPDAVFVALARGSSRSGYELIFSECFDSCEKTEKTFARKPKKSN